MSLILLGKNGQVGFELQRTLLPFGRMMAVGRDVIDLEATDELAGKFAGFRPEIIANAAAFTQVDLAEANSEAAFRVNRDAVRIMAEYARDRNALLVHYSTDYVFSGDKTSPYVETDETQPLNVYGRSKRDGELAIKATGCRHLLFRTSWVFSAEGANFIATILRLARERPSLRVVADQFGAPTSAELIADVTALAVAACRRGDMAGGTYHLTATGRTSWHELACYVVRRALEIGFELKAGADDIEPITTRDYPRPAARPHNSSLNTDAIASALGITLPHWTVHVDRMLDQLRKRGWMP
ncbi:dTDP-4-dehydrorhamnose reductase [Rhizobium sp. Root1203]|jgi:dTDP-4-dehydrorhamnose reductase|uniref:dTDP-4-dehydrorhamnose reductase n=1 Tax=Rhizobium sp. Root1203 TaxID=1736427 RepID=UPI00070B6C9F|nr:dTDP-4-dehydrorhamnose reductase [Rhizobium sp. Root1203]KQV30852.1 dTDP-4-dehydrorhamnose reductase [Rhizobium sp. Root1203]